MRAGAAALAAAVMAGCSSGPPRVAPPPAAAVFSHADLDTFLQRHVDASGRVDYAAAATDRADLDRYVAAIAQASPDSHPERFPDDDARLAYWINAYNASAIAIVLAHAPIESVRDVRPPRALFFLPRLAGFFYLQRVTLGGEDVSLYALENAIVRRRFPDPRIHFALNCASAGCPRLPARAFTAEGLDAELERETRRFVDEERNVRLDADARSLHLSSIFDWYEGDFTRWLETRHPDREPSLRNYVLLHLPAGKAAALEACTDCDTAFIPYDWTLNGRG